MKNFLLAFIILTAATSMSFAQTDRDKGIELYRQGEYEKAVEILQSSVKIEEKDRRAWLYLGASFLKLGKESDALKAFRKNVAYKKNLPVYDRQLEITSRPRPNSTEEARKNKPMGTAAVAIEFGKDGKIGFVVPFRTLPDGLTEEIVEAAKNIKFNPAIVAGKPVTEIKVIEYTFMF